MTKPGETIPTVPPFWFEFALRSSRETVIFTDTERRIIYANPAVYQSHGYRPEELLGFTSREIFGDIPGNPPDLGEIVQRAAVGGVWKGEIFNRRKDGSIFPVRLVLSTIYGTNGDVLGYAGISTDISRERDRQEQLENYLRQLQEANSFKTEFISTLSHEIRTPLTSIRAFSNILLKMGDKANEETRRDFIGQIHAAAQRLTGMLNRMLDLSKLESGRMGFSNETVNLTGLAWEAIGDMEGLALETGVKLILDNPPLEIPVLGDPDRLREVFHNLLSNAIKYSPSGEEVTVELSRRENGQSWSEVAISDRGPGIPEGEEESIFNRFQQSSTATGKDGVGLGLTISRRIVEHYGGQLDVRPRPGGGSRFTVRLPIPR